MKLAIICLTKDFNRPGNSGSYRDYLYIKKELELIGEVTTINADNVTKEIETKYDGILMLNASVNFFGGMLNENLVKKWNFICNQSCPVMYWFTDFLLPLQNVRELIYRRFNIALLDLNPNRVTVISYAQETEMTKEWWNGNKKNIPIEKIVYYPISESCYKHLPHLEPQPNPINDVVYIGNFRNGHRLKQIEELTKKGVVTIYGRWPEDKIPFGVEYKGPCLETEVDDILNKSYSQYVTYDYEYLKFKPDIFRHVITINSGCLPLVDPKLDYLTPKILSSRPEDRVHTIKFLQELLKEEFDFNFSELIKNLCS